MMYEQRSIHVIIALLFHLYLLMDTKARNIILKATAANQLFAAGTIQSNIYE